MQLVKIDAVQAQSLEAALYRFAKVRRGRIVRPLIWAGTVPASLGRNHQARRVRKQRFGNQFLADVRAIGIRGVDKLYAKFHGTTKNRQCAFSIFWRAPNAFAGKAHRPVTETMNRDLAAKQNISSRPCRNFLRIHDSPPKFIFHTFPRADSHCARPSTASTCIPSASNTLPLSTIPGMPIRSRTLSGSFTPLRSLRTRYGCPPWSGTNTNGPPAAAHIFAQKA